MIRGKGGRVWPRGGWWGRGRRARVTWLRSGGWQRRGITRIAGRYMRYMRYITRIAGRRTLPVSGRYMRYMRYMGDAPCR